MSSTTQVRSIARRAGRKKPSPQDYAIARRLHYYHPTQNRPLSYFGKLTRKRRTKTGFKALARERRAAFRPLVPVVAVTKPRSKQDSRLVIYGKQLQDVMNDIHKLTPILEGVDTRKNAGKMTEGQRHAAVVLAQRVERKEELEKKMYDIGHPMHGPVHKVKAKKTGPQLMSKLMTTKDALGQVNDNIAKTQHYHPEKLDELRRQQKILENKIEKTYIALHNLY